LAVNGKSRIYTHLPKRERKKKEGGKEKRGGEKGCRGKKKKSKSVSTLAAQTDLRRGVPLKKVPDKAHVEKGGGASKRGGRKEADGDVYQTSKCVGQARISENRKLTKQKKS